MTDLTHLSYFLTDLTGGRRVTREPPGPPFRLSKERPEASGCSPDNRTRSETYRHAWKLTEIRRPRKLDAPISPFQSHEIARAA